MSKRVQMPKPWFYWFPVVSSLEMTHNTDAGEKTRSNVLLSEVLVLVLLLPFKTTQRSQPVDRTFGNLWSSRSLRAILGPLTEKIPRRCDTKCFPRLQSFFRKAVSMFSVGFRKMRYSLSPTCLQFLVGFPRTFWYDPKTAFFFAIFVFSMEIYRVYKWFQGKYDSVLSLVRVARKSAVLRKPANTTVLFALSSHLRDGLPEIEKYTPPPPLPLCGKWG